MAVFNNAWNYTGTAAAAESTRGTIRHLLYGPEGPPLEDRANELLEGEKSVVMAGFKEALLKVLLRATRPLLVDPHLHLPARRREARDRAGCTRPNRPNRRERTGGADG